MTRPPLHTEEELNAALIEAQQKEIERLQAELADLRRDFPEIFEGEAAWLQGWQDERARLRAALTEIQRGCEKYMTKGFNGRLGDMLAQSCLNVVRDALARSKAS